MLVCFFQGFDYSDSTTYDEYKMVLVVRHDLGMGKGKIAAQVSCFSCLYIPLPSKL